MSKKAAIQGLLNRNARQPGENVAKEELLEDHRPEIQEVVNAPIQKTVKKATFELDAELHLWLKLYSVKNGKNMVDVVEEALKAYRQEHD